MINDYIKAVFFDLGQTLVQLSELSTCMTNSLKKHISKFDIDVTDFAQTWGEETYNIYSNLRGKQFLKAKIIHKIGLKNILQHKGVEFDDTVLNSIVNNVWDEFTKNNTLYPDVIPTLQQLKETNIKLGIITDCDDDIATAVMKKNNLQEYININIISSDYKAYKPHPILFKKAIQLAKCKAINALYVGDSEIDIKGAKDVGLKTIIIKRHEITDHKKGINPDFTIDNLVMIPKIISEIHH